MSVQEKIHFEKAEKVEKGDQSYAFVCVYLCVCVGASVCMCVHPHACACIYVCMRASVCVHLCGCICVRAYVRVYVCVCLVLSGMAYDMKWDVALVYGAQSHTLLQPQATGSEQ